MASIVRIKRSTGTNAPSALNFGELAYTESVGTHGNKGGRLFVGDQNGLSGDVDVIGGKYYSDLLSIGPGLIAGQTNAATAANGFVPVVDQNRKVDQWNVDNLTLDGNTLSSTDANGDIIIAPEDTGSSPVDAGAVIIPDDTYLAFGSGKDGKIDSSIVEEVVKELAPRGCPIIIKSTVTPDVLEKLWKKNKMIVYNPEFLTEKNALNDFVNPPMHVFGGSPEITKQVIGMAQRPGRTGPLNIWNLRYSQE